MDLHILLFMTLKQCIPGSGPPMKLISLDHP